MTCLKDVLINVLLETQLLVLYENSMAMLGSLVMCTVILINSIEAKIGPLRGNILGTFSEQAQCLN